MSLHCWVRTTFTFLSFLPSFRSVLAYSNISVRTKIREGQPYVVSHHAFSSHAPSLLIHRHHCSEQKTTAFIRVPSRSTTDSNGRHRFSSSQTKTISSFCSNNHAEGIKKENHSPIVWLSIDEVQQLAWHTGISMKTIMDWFVDASAFDRTARMIQNDDTLPKDQQNLDENINLVPSYVRLRNHGPIYERALALFSITESGYPRTPLPPTVLLAEYVVSTTLRWCSQFVAAPDLNLCPWAKGSLNSSYAVRIKVLLPLSKQSQRGKKDCRKRMECIVRDSGLELIRLSSVLGSSELGDSQLYHGYDESIRGLDADRQQHGVGQLSTPIPSLFVDPNAAITFVVAAPPYSSLNNYSTLEFFEQHPEFAENSIHATYKSTRDNLFDFDTFYEFVTDFEDRLLDEADREDDRTHSLPREVMNNSHGRNNICVGKDVTIAPFHPQWFFSFPTGQDDDDDVNLSRGEPRENPLNYEKRSPFPTISLVRSDVIESAGEEVTERIGIHNEQVLQSMGHHLLGQIYRERIWK